MSNLSTSLKCMLIGESGVGKTSLVVSYARDDYPPQYNPTALDKYALDIFIEDRPVNVQIYDAGGSPDVSALRRLAYPDVHCILLCFSVVRPETLWALRNRWLAELSQNIYLNPVATFTASRLCSLSTERNEIIVGNGNPNSKSPIKSSLSHRTSEHHQTVSFPPRRHVNCRSRHRLPPGPAFILVGCACDLRNDIKRLLDLSNRNEAPVDEHIAQKIATEFGADAYIECSAITQKQLKKVFDLAIFHGLQIKDAGGPTPLSNSSFLSMDGSIKLLPNESSSLTENFSSNSQILQSTSLLKAATPSPTVEHRVLQEKTPRRHRSFESCSGKRIISPKNSVNRSTRSVWKKLSCFP